MVYNETNLKLWVIKPSLLGTFLATVLSALEKQANGVVENQAVFLGFQTNLISFIVEVQNICFEMSLLSIDYNTTDDFMY